MSYSAQSDWFLYYQAISSYITRNENKMAEYFAKVNQKSGICLIKQHEKMPKITTSVCILYNIPLNLSVRRSVSQFAVTYYSIIVFLPVYKKNNKTIIEV